jgi:hypothetical protein
LVFGNLTIVADRVERFIVGDPNATVLSRESRNFGRDH